MIVVVGRVPVTPEPGLFAEPVAGRIARREGQVEVVSVVPDGPAGDQTLARLAEAGIRHAATLRSSAATLDTADLELALRYLPDVRVIVLASDEVALRAAAVRAGTWSGAALITLRADGSTVPDDAADAGALEIVLQGPASDPDGAFAGLVAELAVRLDAGEAPAAAWRRVTTDLSVDAVSRSSARDPRRPG